MSEPKKTLRQILEEVAKRPTTAEYELALVEFLEMSDAQQKSIIFRQIVNLGAQINWIMERMRR